MKETLIERLVRVFNELSKLVFGSKIRIFFSNQTKSELVKKSQIGWVPLMGYCSPKSVRTIRKSIKNQGYLPKEAIVIYRHPMRGFLTRAKNQGRCDAAIISNISHELRHRFQQQNRQLKLYSLKNLLKWMANKEGKEDWERVFEPLVELCSTSDIEKSKDEKDAFCVSVMASYTWEKTKDLKAVTQIIKSEPK